MGVSNSPRKIQSINFSPVILPLVEPNTSFPKVSQVGIRASSLWLRRYPKMDGENNGKPYQNG